jgi:YidC/Oxa1 family membrane protein insertase
MTDPRRTILWMVFIVSLLFLFESWQHYNGRDSMLFGAAPKSAQAEASSSGNPNSDLPSMAPPLDDKALAASGAAVANLPGVPEATAVASATGEPVQIRTDMFALAINTLGAEIDHLELLTQKDQEHTDQNMVLLQQTKDNTYLAETGLLASGAQLPTQHTLFTLTPGPTHLAEGQNSFDVTLTAESGGVKLVKTYTFTRGSYVIGVRHQVTNLSGAPLSPSLYLQLVRDSSKPAGTMRFYSPYYGPAVFTAADGFQKISFSDIEKKKDDSNEREATNGWVAMLQHYFATAWIPPEGTPRAYVTQAIAGTPNFRAAAVLPLGLIAPQQTVTNDSKLFVGPEEARVLQEVAPGLELTRDYGWTRILAQPVFWCLEHLHGVLGNWGWAIIVLTLGIKLAFFPLSAASYRSMARMKAVAPRLKLLQEKYKDDRMKLNQAMMELYKTEKINPAGGCLPILIQIPVFISLYATLSASVEMRGAPWIGWIHDLGAPDPFYILPIIMMVSMFVQYKLNPAPADPAQAKVMMIMPLVFGVTFFFFPAGLVLYWVTNNLLSIAQQYSITRVISKPPAAAAASGSSTS